MAHKALAGGQIAVRLNKHRALDLPAPLGDTLLDLLIDLRCVFLDIEIKLRLAGHEFVFRIAAHQLQHGGEAAYRLVFGHGERPEPRDVDVRMPNAEDARTVISRVGVKLLPQERARSLHTCVERFISGLAQIEQIDRLVQRLDNADILCVVLIQQARGLPWYEQVIIQPLDLAVYGVQRGVKYQMKVLHAGIGGKENRKALAGLCTLGERELVMVDIEALPQFAVYVYAELRIRRIPLPLAAGEQRELRRMPREGLREREVGDEGVIFAVAAPDAVRGNCTPARAGLGRGGALFAGRAQHFPAYCRDCFRITQQRQLPQDLTNSFFCEHLSYLYFMI